LAAGSDVPKKYIDRFDDLVLRPGRDDSVVAKHASRI